MNKKLTILIVALECVFAVFLISIFGPMVESLHAKKLVEDVYFVDESSERIEDDAVIYVDLDISRSFHYSFVVGPEDATDKTVKVLHNRTDDEIEIELDAGGMGFTVHFLTKNISGVEITLRANDQSQRQATINLSKRLADVNIGDDF